MCLAVPAKVIDIIDLLATVEVGGITRQISLMLLPDVTIGDFVLVHAGFAIQKVDQEEARRTTELLKELAGYAE
ncbi:HypC/HybG/HupF family hydrogenase formation chaperone [Acetonema longum]|uniref:Hydrogenase assembly chaperone hypC/hupF n=1 Tax=Acetonema longum DSM 6540 TaxID=1009370 RepID=F7NIS8_9FIRM|nr:HypC/HybG/HupF family hydrogenase formation chaperone [Acetonema longum]EGO64051.1 hydrogenase assembly chaperone hypC/hupF [Acetonema longum DSM 6540]